MARPGSARQDGMDQVFFRTYRPGEELDRIEPLNWTAASSHFRGDIKLDLIVITGVGRVTHELDELRIGTSWASVTPSP